MTPYSKLLSYLFLTLMTFASTCKIVIGQSSNPDSHTIILIGDAGEPIPGGKDPVMSMLKKRVDQLGSSSTVVFLGDNIYPSGLPDAEDPGRKESEEKINAQLEAVKDHMGNIIMIPGNHDWNKMKKGGWQAVQREEEYVETYLNKGNVFLPDHGCPGPVEISLSDNAVLIVIDSEWWLHKWERPEGKQGDCNAKDETEFISALEDALHRNSGKQVIVTGHHPIFTKGPHGGRFPLKDHLFPLTNAADWLYIPFPVIGSIYPFYRKFTGHRQDIAHPHYQLFRNQLVATFSKHPNLIYTAGHEHSIQYYKKGEQHYIVSGSGSKTSHLPNKIKAAAYSASKKGFVELTINSDGSVSMQTWVLENDTQQSSFSELIIPPRSQTQKSEEIPAQQVDYSDSTITIIPGEIYDGSLVKRFLLGNQYRETWLTPIEVPYLNISKEKGGLTPIQKGGGQQTRSLRFESKDGKHYVIRSVQKYPINAIPKLLRKTIAADVVQEMISIAHPYGAILVPKLADAAGIYHTNPKLVYVPDDPALGQYRSEFAGMLAIFEERPADDQSDSPFFGNSEDVVSSPKMYKKIHQDNDNQVDQAFFLRSRLFDIFLNDWDRHEDQWRWASFEGEDGKGKIYRAIPRDRDQVFTKFEGLLPSMANRKWGLRKFQAFDYDIRDIAGLCFNGRYVDRHFLTSLSLEEWLTIAEDLQKRLTDEVIEDAINDLPEKPYELEGDIIIAKLKARRDNLTRFAETYYRILATHVEIIGSDKHELFEVKRLNDEDTEVTVYKTNGDHKREKVIYHRVFHRSETKEVRLYGLDNSDRFVLIGEVKKGIKVRIIGGGGKDHIVDQSKVSGLSKKTVVYDKEKNTTIEKSKETANKTTDKDPAINEYDQRSFKYDYLGPIAFFGYNIDDGVFVGAGGLLKKHGFRKTPHKYSQQLAGNYAIATDAFRIKYEGDFRAVLGKWNLITDGDLRAISYVNNFFGLGNETKLLVDDDELDYNRMRLTQGMAHTLLSRASKNGNHHTGIGPQYQYTKVDRTEGRFVADSVSNLESSDFRDKHYVGALFKYDYENVDNKIIPHRGVRFSTSQGWLANVKDPNSNFFNLASEFSVYWRTPIFFRPVLATRIGGATNIGDFEFFQANTIGGLQQIRGLRRNRFSGRSSAYFNSELRYNVYQLQTYVLPIDFGILGHFDAGRVWLDSEDSEVIHSSYGGGVWISILDAVVITTVYSVSDDDELINLQFGFLF